MQMLPTRTRTAVCHVEAVETSGSAHLYIAGLSLWDTELMLCSAAFACRGEDRTLALILEAFEFTSLVWTFAGNSILACSLSLSPAYTPTATHRCILTMARNFADDPSSASSSYLSRH